MLTPCDFGDLQEVAQRLLTFERRYVAAAAPFEWKFTRRDLARVLDRLRGEHPTRLSQAS